MHALQVSVFVLFTLYTRSVQMCMCFSSLGSRISIKMRGNPIGDNTSPSSARGLLFHTVPLLWIKGHGKDIKGEQIALFMRQSTLGTNNCILMHHQLEVLRVIVLNVLGIVSYVFIRDFSGQVFLLRWFIT